MDIFAVLLLVLYTIVILWLSLYGVNAYYLIYLFRKFGRGREEADRRIVEDFWKGSRTLPRVTVQLPLYNEKYVAQRLLEATSRIRYPKDLLEIQVLDDSTDETSRIVQELVSRYARDGFRIEHIRRANREGFKAGALAEGMKSSYGEYLAIFDADFLPPEDFLEQTVPFFYENPEIALVQTRWGHMNDKYSLLTKAISIGIDGHFVVEQGGRNWSGLFMNFNGTAGIWRKAAIADAGGWQSDTLTEDMDLSYRAHLRGWKMKFISSLVTPGEIPVDINALKSQQYRWAKGSIQTAKKLLPKILKSPISLRLKIQSFLHMTHYMIHFLILSVAILSIPILITSGFSSLNFKAFVFLVTLLVISTCGPSALYVYSQKAIGNKWRGRWHLIPFLVVVGCGVAVNNTRAVLEALLNIQSGFVRTPKLDIVKAGDNFKDKQYKIPLNPVIFGEMFMGCYCLFGVWLYLHDYRFLVGPFLIMYALGFSYVALASLLHSWGHRVSSQNIAEKSGIIPVMLKEKAIVGIRRKLNGRM
jgi:cellulose synthase/poly-beta-1,6-N-acetylglucosamine synthase-like glycosyltransferase